MKNLFLIICTIFILTACGSTAIKSDDAAQIRQTNKNIYTALLSKTPENACRYYTNMGNDECLSGIIIVKNLNIKPSSTIPVNWETLADKAVIKVKGKTATLDMNPSDPKNIRFVKVNGQWLRNS